MYLIAIDRHRRSNWWTYLFENIFLFKSGIARRLDKISSIYIIIIMPSVQGIMNVLISIMHPLVELHYLSVSYFVLVQDSSCTHVARESKNQVTENIFHTDIIKLRNISVIIF